MEESFSALPCSEIATASHAIGREGIPLKPAESGRDFCLNDGFAIARADHSDAVSDAYDSGSPSDSGLDLPPAHHLHEGGSASSATVALHTSDRARKSGSHPLCLVALAAFLVLVYVGIVASHNLTTDSKLSAAWTARSPSSERRAFKESAHDARASPSINGRRIGGHGCGMSRCSNDRVFEVGGLATQPWPHLYILVPFRNRLASLARLVSSLNAATTPAIRACTCIVLADYKTALAAVPAWQNPACIATYNVEFRMYMQEDDLDEYGRPLEVWVTATAAPIQARCHTCRAPCPSTGR